MRYIRGQIRRARRGQSLSQAALAERSGVSRVTIARLEAGKGHDVRLETVARLCAALGLEVAAVPPRAEAAPAQREQRLAREQAAARRLERRLLHAELAARLLSRPRETAGLVRMARAAVERWERDRLCSRHYIRRWRAMLAGSPERVARSLLRPGEWQDALFQNTPWSFAFPGARR